MRRRVALVASMVVALVLAGVTPSEAARDAACRGGNPMANVYLPFRLKVIDRCVEVGGVVVSSRREGDGDEHISLRVDPPYEGFLNDGNRRFHGGTLVLEIVPADQPGCRKGDRVRWGTCTGAHIATPRNGVHVLVVGVFVLDRLHRWDEIHPVWAIRGSWSFRPSAHTIGERRSPERGSTGSDRSGEGRVPY
jgi:hypothetical protein